MKNNKGFSLVELIVVIAIMAILAAVAIPTFATFITKANEAADKDFANGIEYAVELALTAEGDKATAIAVTWDATKDEIQKLTYTVDSKVYVVKGTKTGEEVDATTTDIAKDILAVIDTEYDLKIEKELNEGIVTITMAQ